MSLFGTLLELWFSANSKALITNLNNLHNWCCKRKQLGNGSLNDHSKTTQTGSGFENSCPSPLSTCSGPLYMHTSSFFTLSNRPFIMFYRILNWAWWHQATDACRLFFLSSSFTARLLHSLHTVKKKQQSSTQTLTNKPIHLSLWHIH